MTSLFNTVSNAFDSFKVTNTGNAIMANGNTAIMAIGLYKCSEGTCAGSSNMLYIEGLNGHVKCVEDNASCHLNGEQAIRLMSVDGTGGGKLTLRALGFVGGKAREGGGVYFNSNAIVDIELCLFVNCLGMSSVYGGGGIYVWSGDINLYGTNFNHNFALSGKGADIYINSINHDPGKFTIHDICPSSYSSTIPYKGKIRCCPL
jgi:hypothetical protein